MRTAAGIFDKMRNGRLTPRGAVNQPASTAARRARRSEPETITDSHPALSVIHLPGKNKKGIGKIEQGDKKRLRLSEKNVMADRSGPPSGRFPEYVSACDVCYLLSWLSIPPLLSVSAVSRRVPSTAALSPVSCMEITGRDRRVLRLPRN